MGGVTGDDENRTLLEKLMDEAKIDYSGLIRSSRRETITKIACIRWQSANLCVLTLKKQVICILEEIVPLKSWLEKIIGTGAGWYYCFRLC